MILGVESVEPRFSRWTVGAEAAVVGLPRDVEFEYVAAHQSAPWTPKGYNQASEQSLEADSTYRTYHTYLDWDYDHNPYDGASGEQGGKYGPSSNHPCVVNHLFVDGTIRSVPRSIDVELYMFLISRHDW